MIEGGRLDALVSAAASPLVSTRPVSLLKTRSNSTNDDQFLKMLAGQLSQAKSPYRPADATVADIELMLSQLDTDKLREIDDAGRQFESLLLFTLFKQMWDTLPESTMLGSGLDSEIYREMWLEEMAGDIASSGQGLGIAPNMNWEMIYRETNTVAPENTDLDIRL